MGRWGADWVTTARLGHGVEATHALRPRSGRARRTGGQRLQSRRPRWREQGEQGKATAYTWEQGGRGRRLLTSGLSLESCAAQGSSRRRTAMKQTPGADAVAEEEEADERLRHAGLNCWLLETL